jgi:beta-glucosidase
MNNKMSRTEARKKAKELVSQMTVDEKIAQLEFDAPEIERLSIPEHNYWNEGLHGVANAGTATMFPQAIGMAAMFDEKLLEKVGEVISTEARAKYNEFIKHNDRDIYKGLTYWSPNVNIFRDPRWGRGQETYGEDPYLSGQLGIAFINGLQGNEKYLKIAACAKHFAVHSGPEPLRHYFNAEVSQKDLHETYLPAFKSAVIDGQVESVMTAYNRINGAPASVNKELLSVLRDDWKFEGHVVSDYLALEDVNKNHKYTSNEQQTMALALKSGLDLCAGHIAKYLKTALDEKLITEKEIDTSVIRLMTTRILLGMFSTDNKYDQIPFEVNDCKEHKEIALDVTRKSFVLLKNDGILPLNNKSINTIAVIGPTANERSVLKGNYFGTASKYTTFLEGIQEKVAENTRILFSEGCHLFKKSIKRLARENDRISEALSVAEHSDLIILCLGFDSSMEGEEGDPGNEYPAGDRENLGFPRLQQKLLEDLLTVGKPVILVSTSGSPLTYGGLETHPNLKGIMHAWYPGAQGGVALADILFGEVSPSGKLPITFYKSENDLPDFIDYSMVNRTYRYMSTDALYPFGYGLTYSNVELENANIDNKTKDVSDVSVTLDVSNTGRIDTDEVIQVYIKDTDSLYSPLNPRLGAFKRVFIKKGETKRITISIPKNSFMITDSEGVSCLDGENYDVYIGLGQPDERTEFLTKKKSIIKKINRL